MKRILFATIIFTSLSLTSYSQNWADALIRADGQKILDGVEVHYIKTTCNNEDFVLVKFINHNNFEVKLEWVNAIFSKNEWFYSKEQTSKTLLLKPNQEMTGNCNAENVCLIKIKSILDDAQDFEHFSVSGLKVN